MRRIWVYLRESTVQLAIETLRGAWAKASSGWGSDQGRELDTAAEDLKRAKRLADTKVTREEIEHVTRKRDEQGGP